MTIYKNVLIWYFVELKTYLVQKELTIFSKFLFSSVSTNVFQNRIKQRETCILNSKTTNQLK